MQILQLTLRLAALWLAFVSDCYKCLQRRSPLLLLVIIGCTRPVLAEGVWSQFTDPDEGHFDASSYLADNAYGFLPMLIIITDPAVDGDLGLAGIFFHETDEQKDRRLAALKNTEEESARFLQRPD